MAKRVTGEMYEGITGQLFEIGRQLRQVNGYPFNPKLLQSYLQAAIEGNFFPYVWPVWKTLKFQKFETPDNARKILKENNIRVSNWANDIIGKIDFAKEEKDEVEDQLVIVSGLYLGFKDNATRKQICNRAFECGLELLSPEKGPKIRLQYLDQPNGEWLYVAMEPIIASDGDPNIFKVERDDAGLFWLYCSFDHPGSLWNPKNRWVFRLRNSLHFSPLSGEFCFESWPFHPPSILPISSTSE